MFKFHKTPLNIAVEKGKYEIVKQFLDFEILNINLTSVLIFLMNKILKKSFLITFKIK